MSLAEHRLTRKTADPFAVMSVIYNCVALSRLFSTEPVCNQHIIASHGSTDNERPALVYSCYLPYDSNGFTVIRQCTESNTAFEDPLVCELTGTIECVRYSNIVLCAR